MGVRNVLVEGLSGTGKTSVCDELQRRGFDAIHGDRTLAYQGDPTTGAPTDVPAHEHHLWDVAVVRRLAADRSVGVTFFCGGSRNWPELIDVFDRVFVLAVDAETLRRRLDARPLGEFGGRPAERDFVLRLHAAGGDQPTGPRVVVLDATEPLAQVVDRILAGSAPPGRGPAGPP